MTRGDVERLLEVCESVGMQLRVAGQMTMPDFDGFLGRVLWAVRASSDTPSFDEGKFRLFARTGEGSMDAVFMGAGEGAVGLPMPEVAPAAPEPAAAELVPDPQQAAEVQYAVGNPAHSIAVPPEPPLRPVTAGQLGYDGELIEDSEEGEPDADDDLPWGPDRAHEDREPSPGLRHRTPRRPARKKR